MKNNYSWEHFLKVEQEKAYYQTLQHWIKLQRSQEVPIYPPEEQVLRCLQLTPFAQVKVVILGQDPYHGANQANGLCFSVNKGLKIPPSLRNIYKELQQSIDFKVPQHGDLTEWAKQGVLLLNTVMTVSHAQPQSHQKQGWEEFTDQIIQYLNNAQAGIVFLLWGAPARSKIKLIDQNKHHVLEAPHPSPLSAHRGFLGCNHFKLANQLLKDNGKSVIDWCIQDHQENLNLF